MSRYLFTLFVRFTICVSGFVVFLVTSNLFGAEGRGVIGYGTSMVSVIGLFLSFNLGRSFLSKTKNNKSLKYKILPSFLAINYLLIIFGIIIYLLFWLLNDQARVIIDFPLTIAFAILLPYYLWSVNGSSIFATLDKTSRQDAFILIQRVVLVLFMMIAYVINLENLTLFLFTYAIIMGCGALSEMAFLGSPRGGLSKIFKVYDYISNSKNVHFDYLAFNTFPLILILLAGSFLTLSELGSLNFVIQLINFVFIISTVASIRMKSYVAEKGVAQYSRSIKRLLALTFILSFCSILFIYFFLSSDFFYKNFSSFVDVLPYFFIATLAIPGYILYQFMYPALIEYNLIDISMKFNLVIFFVLIAFTYIALKLYGLLGGILLFSIFYLLILLVQLYLFKKLRMKMVQS
jgi:O-antigen/teichoic acid export membrane protein